MRAKREEEERKRQEELRRQQEEILRRQQEEERKRREEEELARRKQVTLSHSDAGLVPKEGFQGSSLTPIISQAVVHKDGLSKVNNRIGTLEDSLPFRVSCPRMLTGGIVLSPSKTLEFISFAYFLGFYKPVRYEK